MDPSKRFVTLVLAAGVAVLLVAIVLGEHMGARVLNRAENSGSLETTPIVTPLPVATSGDGYGPDWKQSQTLAAPPDPGFPDPRIPPKPLPTPEPTASPSPKPKWTPNPKLPIWDQTPPPSASQSPTAPETGSPEPQPSVSPSASPGTNPATTPLP